MRKIFLILSTITILIFTGCRRDDIIEPTPVELFNENIEVGWDYIKLSVEYHFPIEIKGVKIHISGREDLFDFKVYDCIIENGCIIAEARDLVENTKYYYRFEYDHGYGTINSKVFDFMTEMKPDVTTNEVKNITTSSAVFNGSVLSTGSGDFIIARGFCWGVKPSPTIDDNVSNNGNEIGDYTYTVTGLSENTIYYVRAYVSNEKDTAYGEEKAFSTKPGVNGYEYVDLGLPSGLKWAAYNVGATAPYEYGNYYAWGESEVKDVYNSGNSITHGADVSDISGNIQYDVAAKEWGGGWRIPTDSEQRELLDHCLWEWTIQDGTSGYKVTGSNGNSIFLPAGGYFYESSCYDVKNYGYYWSSTPYESSTNYTYGIRFGNNIHGVEYYNRYGGRNVRAVIETS